MIMVNVKFEFSDSEFRIFQLYSLKKINFKNFQRYEIIFLKITCNINTPQFHFTVIIVTTKLLNPCRITIWGYSIFIELLRGDIQTKKRDFLGIFPKGGGGSSRFPKLFHIYRFVFLCQNMDILRGGPIFPKVRTGSFGGNPYSQK